MSKIDKLSIMGVRSFDNRVAETVQFFAPLTLIVGVNGSGKTTVIECLKYVTTGELPGNSARGGAFIHDPQLCGEKEVLGQVKLAFRSTESVRMVATRNLQLTVKKTTRTQKTLEGSLQMIKDGERTSISSRVADMDIMLPKFLGASKAILDWVIFCHQEESLWPMSEAGNLKKRFDEIFAATKFTKVIINLKDLRKKQVEELAKLKLLEEQARRDKDIADKDRQRMESLSDDIEGLRVQVERVKRIIKDVSEHYDAVWERKIKLTKLREEWSVNKIEVNAQKRTIDNILIAKPLSESTCEIEDMLDRYEERVGVSEAELAVEIGRVEAIDRDLLIVKQELEDSLNKLGRYEAEKDLYERRVKERCLMIREVSGQLGIQRYDNEPVQDVVQKIVKCLGDMRRNLEGKKDAIRKGIEEDQRQVNELTEKMNGLTRQNEESEEKLKAKRIKITQLNEELQGLHIDEDEIRRKEGLLEGVEIKLDKVKNENVLTSVRGEIEELEQARICKEKIKENLEAELADGMVKAQEIGRYEYLRKSLDECKDVYTKMKIKVESMLRKSVMDEQADIAWDTVKEKVEDAKKVIYEECKVKGQLWSEMRIRKEQVNGREQDLVGRLANKQNQKAKYEEAVERVMKDRGGIGEYEKEWQKVVKQREMIEDDRKSWREMKRWFEKCIEVLDEQGICRLCSRQLQQGEREKFLEHLREKIDEWEVHTDDNGNKVVEEWVKMKQVSDEYEGWKNMTAEVKELQYELDKSCVEKVRVEKELKLRENELRESERIKREIDSINEELCLLEAQNDKMDKMVEQISMLERQIGKDGGKNGQRLTDIQVENGKVGEEVRKIKEEIEEKRHQKEDWEREEQRLEIEVLDLRLECTKLREKQREVLRIHERLGEMKDDKEGEERLVERREENLKQVRAQVEHFKRMLDDKISDMVEVERESGGSLDKMEVIVKAIEDRNNEIMEYDVDKLKQFGKDVEEKRYRERLLNEQKAEFSESIRVMESEIVEMADKKREMELNLRYRREMTKLKDVEGRVSELEKEMRIVAEELVEYERQISRNPHVHEDDGDNSEGEKEQTNSVFSGDRDTKRNLYTSKSRFPADRVTADYAKVDVCEEKYFSDEEQQRLNRVLRVRSISSSNGYDDNDDNTIKPSGLNKDKMGGVLRNWEELCTRLGKKRNRLSAKQGLILGEMKGKDEELEGLIDRWNTDWKKSEEKFIESRIRVETSKATCEDLAKAIKAIDLAVMKFHCHAMKKINSILEELWKKTYQGNDIDSIEIRSEWEGQKDGKETRSYNYRVVMIKSDCEMDMRARCSTGQKMLASILIRLALSEVLGRDCGILTLDEPTTNLDEDNSKSLAIALNEIIRSRRHQANFQLVIITHDEMFLKYMKCAEFSDYYWRISRNPSLKSIIERQSIRLVE